MLMNISVSMPELAKSLRVTLDLAGQTKTINKKFNNNIKQFITIQFRQQIHKIT